MNSLKEYVLVTEDVTKVYGKHKAVNRVSMHVEKGAIYGFIGKNGAGKTTFMRMVAGLATPTMGQMELFGSKDLERQRIRIGTLIENPGAFGNMTAYENLEVVRRQFGITDKHVVGGMLEFVGLSGTGKKKVKNFSMGMKQRLGIGIALLRNPDFLILDEPINGLDPEGIIEIRELLLKLNREREITILISSHILGELSKIATHYGIIRDGALIEEFGEQELVNRCRRCHKVIVDNTELAANILEEKLHITGFDIPQQNTVRIFERLEETEKTNRELVVGGVNVKESYLAGQDLEGYFMELLGGGENV
ncbi:MAG: ATP-binding cassette domain-containing protein [Lachnospiraceae bacterium]|nr:ATP-binding cassette domain-containing protein [Lachnospiraceae bacterium]